MHVHVKTHMFCVDVMTRWSKIVVQCIQSLFTCRRFFFDFFFGATKIHKTCDTHTYIHSHPHWRRWDELFVKIRLKCAKEAILLSLIRKMTKPDLNRQRMNLYLIYSQLYTMAEREKKRKTVYIFLCPPLIFIKTKISHNLITLL